ncbi:MAG: hypothetical protein RLZZ230_771 [Candidatus Parcubacteria bacterium]|jgi:glycosyltransferase involved in cell wall biosynthesis
MISQKRILYIITKSNFGGAQKYVFELAEAAKADGHLVEVACGGTGAAGATVGRLVELLEAESIPVHRIENFMRNMSPANDLKAFFEIWHLLRRLKPDVIHVTSSKAGGIGALAGRLAGIKRIIFTSHGLTVDEVWRPRWQRLLIYLGTWVTLRLAHHSIMISTETFDRARQMPGLMSRVSLIKNGIAPIKFLERVEARAELAPRLHPNTLWIGGIGELHPNKNWSAAIEAVTTLPPHAHLFIIGEGDEHLKLEDLISELGLNQQVHLLGYIDGAQYLKAFDIFILPSKKEGLPYVLLEAGLAGLPVIASDLSGNHDIVSTGETGFLIEPTPELISATLQMLIRDEGMRRRLGTALQESVSANFSIETMYRKTFSLYTSNTSAVSKRTGA